MFRVLAAELNDKLTIQAMSREAVVTSLSRVGVPFNSPPSRQLTWPVETGGQVLKAITCKQSTNARLSILILSKSYPTSGN